MRLFQIRSAMITSLVGLCLLSSVLLADNSPTERLSWAPFDFLKQGYRNAPWVKDPFYPEGDSLRVMGIISNEMAFINGQWLHPGEKVSGYVIKKIGPNGVVLTRNSEILLLKLDEDATQ